MGKRGGDPASVSFSYNRTHNATIFRRGERQNRFDFCNVFISVRGNLRDHNENKHAIYKFFPALRKAYIKVVRHHFACRVSAYACSGTCRRDTAACGICA